MNTHLSRPIGLVAALFCFALASPASAELAPERLQEHLQSFELIRKTIETRYPTPARLDDAWRGDVDRLAAELPTVQSDEAARDIMVELVHLLGDSHFEIIPDQHYESIYEFEHEDLPEDETDPADGADDSDSEEEDSGVEGTSGVSIRLIDGKTVITRVEPGSSGEERGLRAGDEVVRVGSVDSSWFIDTIRERGEDSPTRVETMVAIAMGLRLSGKVGKYTSMDYLDVNGDTLSADLGFKPWEGVVTTLGALPPQTVSTYSQDLGVAGLIGFNMFLAPNTVMPFVADSFERFREKRGIIIDMRGNLGGIMAMIQGIVGWFVHEPTQLGLLKMNGSELKLFANPRPQVYEGRVAVLTDEMSISSAEVFTAAMRDAVQARSFGERTAGLALPANVVKLPNGDGFLFVVAEYTTALGQRLERTGVVPDVPVPLTRTALYESTDPVLDAAVRWIENGTD